MVVRLLYGRRNKGLRLGLNRWSISGVCSVFGGWIRELCGVMKSVIKRIDGLFQWFSHMERMENDRNAERVYMEEYRSIQSIG